MAETKLPVTSVDAPSSWDIEEGPPKSGVGSNFHPDVLISLTAPKPLVKHFRGRHFIGGRYVPRFPFCPVLVVFCRLAERLDQVRRAGDREEV